MLTNAVSLELTLARNHFGPLDDGARARILAALEHVGPETWDDVAGLVVADEGAGLTLWQAVCTIDKTFPRTASVAGACGAPRTWERTPTRTLLIEALRYATH